MSDDRELRMLGAAWYYREQFGFSKPPPKSDPEVVHNMALCLLTVVNGDGEISAEERSWILGYFATKGYGADLIAKMQSLTPPAPFGVSELMNLGILKASGRILLYDAIRAASSDGYHPGEMRVVRVVAKALGIDDAAVDAMEGLVSEEAALRLKRIKLLMPGGHPSLDPALKV